MNNLQNEQVKSYQDHYGNNYSYNDLLNMSFEQLEALEKGEAVNTQQNTETLENSNTQEKGWQKTLGVHPALKKDKKDIKSTITTIIMIFCLLFSGFFALYINLIL